MLVAKDWTSEIKSNLPDIDEETANDINLMLQDYHDPKKEEMVAYWLLDRKTIEYPFSRKTKSEIDNACNVVLENNRDSQAFFKIKYKDYDSPHELLEDQSFVGAEPDDSYDREKKWAENHPELIGLFMLRGIDREVSWDDEREFVRIYLDSPKKFQDECSNAESMVKMIKDVNKIGGVSLEDFESLEEIHWILLFIDTIGDHMDPLGHAAKTCVAFIDRLSQNDPASVAELMKYSFNVNKKSAMIRLIAMCGRTPESMLLYMLRNYDDAYHGINRDIINNRNMTLGTLRKIFDEYKDSPDKTHRTPMLSSIMSSDKFTDTSVIDDMVNGGKNSLYMDRSTNTVLKKYAYEKYGNVKLGDSETVAQKVASSLGENDIALLSMCDDPNVDVRYKLAKNYRLPVEFYLKLVDDTDLKVAKEAAYNGASHHKDNESLVMAIAGNSKLEMRKMLLSEVYRRREKDALYEKSMIEMLSHHDTPLDIKRYVIETSLASPAIADFLSHDKSRLIRDEVAMSRNASPATLEYLSHDTEWSVVRLVMLNHHTHASTIERILSDKSNIDRMSIADIDTVLTRKPDVTVECLKDIYEHAIELDKTTSKNFDYNRTFEYMLCSMLIMPNTPPDIVEKVFDELNSRFGRTEKYKSLAKNIAKNSSVPLELLAKIELEWDIDGDEWRELLSKERNGFDREEYDRIVGMNAR